MNDLTQQSGRDLSPIVEQPTERGFSIQAIINAWINQTARSPRTERAYRATIERFRALCKSFGKDLIYDSPNMDVELSEIAQIFLSQRYDSTDDTEASDQRQSVSAATKAQRLSALSSFYRYAIKHRHTKVANPIDLVDRPSVERYGTAEAFSPETVKRVMSSIPRETKQGAQDFAILSILLMTGRRVSEVAGLRKGHISREGSKLLLRFDEVKNEKHLRDLLEERVSESVEKSVELVHKKTFDELEDDDPIWLDCYHNSQGPLGYRGIMGVVLRWFGTTRVHRLRGTFAVAMDRAGASTAEIQQRLGHSNAATTGIYLNKLKIEKNEHCQLLGEMFGLG